MLTHKNWHVLENDLKSRKTARLIKAQRQKIPQTPAQAKLMRQYTKRMDLQCSTTICCCNVNEVLKVSSKKQSPGCNVTLGLQHGKVWDPLLRWVFQVSDEQNIDQLTPLASLAYWLETRLISKIQRQSFPPLDSQQLSDLEDVLSRRNVGDVDPLTVNVGSVDVVASWAQSLRTQPKPPAECFKALATDKPVFLQVLQMNQTWVLVI